MFMISPIALTAGGVFHYVAGDCGLLRVTEVGNEQFQRVPVAVTGGYQAWIEAYLSL